MVKRVNTLIILLFILIPGFGETIIPEGNVSGEWNASGNPYLISGNITIQPDQNLTIQPGVYVVFQDSYYFQVIGQLTANGNKADSIYFTVLDTTGYANGEHIGWYGMTFNGTTPTQMPQSSLNYCNFEYSLGNGVACLDYSELKISNSSFRKNLSYGIELYSFSNISLNNISISENGMGGISASSSSIELLDFTINNNKGSGISLTGSSNTGSASIISNGVISNNSSEYYGGGLLIAGDALVNCDNIEIKANSAENGGGIYCGVASGNFTSVTISNNSSDFGGGIYCDAYADFTIERSIIASNIANLDGGGLYMIDTYMDFKNVTIANNTAQDNGGGIWSRILANWLPTFENVIVWDNYPESIFTEGSIPSIRFSDIEGGFEGHKNIDSDPLFVNSEANDYNLRWTDFPQSGSGKSACIDGGDPLSVIDPDGTVADIGALFYDQGSITSIETPDAYEIDIYPNPAQNILFINGISEFELLTISNLSGGMVKQYNSIDSFAQINVDNLKPGLYILQISNQNGELITKKFIKK
ncbi:MAG: T9SS type A sorting domain-containing protein [Chlorobi bacterium]|nr:T9SS type A sorting domain-containing protein [Chlorobiota bacterium]